MSEYFLTAHQYLLGYLAISYGVEDVIKERRYDQGIYFRAAWNASAD